VAQRRQKGEMTEHRAKTMQILLMAATARLPLNHLGKKSGRQE